MISPYLAARRARFDAAPGRLFIFLDSIADHQVDQPNEQEAESAGEIEQELVDLVHDSRSASVSSGPKYSTRRRKWLLLIRSLVGSSRRIIVAYGIPVSWATR